MTKDCKEVFTDIYARKVWGDGSGGGSSEQAIPYCQYVNTDIAALVATEYPRRPVVLDIGSGDGRVALNIRAIALNYATYIGVEASRGWVGPMGAPPMNVIQNFDALTDELPPADLVLCKEVLQHLSNEQIQTLLDRTAHYPRRLFTNTNHPSLPVNTDIETGDCRAVDLTLAPFNQPAKTVFTYGHWIVQELTTP